MQDGDGDSLTNDIERDDARLSLISNIAAKSSVLLEATLRAGGDASGAPRSSQMPGDVDFAFQLSSGQIGLTRKATVCVGNRNNSLPC